MGFPTPVNMLDASGRSPTWGRGAGRASGARNKAEGAATRTCGGESEGWVRVLCILAPFFFFSREGVRWDLGRACRVCPGLLRGRPRCGVDGIRAFVRAWHPRSEASLSALCGAGTGDRGGWWLFGGSRGVGEEHSRRSELGTPELVLLCLHRSLAAPFLLPTSQGSAILSISGWGWLVTLSFSF